MLSTYSTLASFSFPFIFLVSVFVASQVLYKANFFREEKRQVGKC
jgi:hypothetical protein